MNKIPYTQMPNKEFKEKMFSVAMELRDMILSTSGCEEGMNVFLTVLASTICSMSAENWLLVEKTATGGVIDEEETEIAEITRVLFIYLGRLRKFSFNNDSKYLKKMSGDELTGNIPSTTTRGPSLPC